MLSMIHLNYQTDLENQKLKYEKMLDRLRLQLKQAQAINGNQQEGVNMVIQVRPNFNSKNLELSLEKALHDKDQIEKEFLNLAENYEQMKNQQEPDSEVMEMKSKEIEELRKENEFLKMNSVMEEDEGFGRNY